MRAAPSLPPPSSDAGSCPESQLSRQLTAVARFTRSRCQQLRLGPWAPTGHNWRRVHLQRGSGVKTGQVIRAASAWVHTSDVPTLFHDRGQSRCKGTALSAPNDPYWAQCSQGGGWSGGTSSSLEPQMVVPSAPVPGTTADTRGPAERPQSRQRQSVDEDLSPKEIQSFEQT